MSVQTTATVLLVEDERELGRVVARELEVAGYRVYLAPDGVTALRIFVEQSPALVVLDWMLPGLDGLEVLRRLRQSSPVPVLMLTARAEEVDRVIGLEVGADDYLTKPFGTRELVARVRALLRRQERLREMLAADRAEGTAAPHLGPLELDLEELAAATGALRAGDLAARVTVGGEDEVGRLQADFNAMAADLEQTLRDLHAERDRVAGLLEARRQLIAGVSHELRTPVATVRGYLESALRLLDPHHPTTDPRSSAGPSMGSGQALRADLETMEREVARLSRLIEDLFTLSRAEVGRLELRLGPTDVGAVVCRLVGTLAPLAWQQRWVQVLAEVAPDLSLARADGERLEQVVSNLLGNAVRHTSPGGLVATTVSAEPDAVRVEVRDTGEGIAPEDLPHIFERFYRGPRISGERHDGAGLGLALVKELAEAMGGSVEVVSTPGEGSCFTVRLPHA
ncbi:MAG: response regulator [Chloroflexi bacterium]|nr:response regulator [Chloroflexota bacterium]